MNNEPVAWMEYIQDEEWKVSFVEPTDLPKGHTYKPLYTHPVKEQELLDEIAHLKHINRNWQISENILLLELEKLQDHPVKDLTDEEIEEIGKQYLSAHAQFIGAGECHYEGEIEFARAILRKASE